MHNLKIGISIAILLLSAIATFSAAAFADGGPLILCPPKAKNCQCTLPHC